MCRTALIEIGRSPRSSESDICETFEVMGEWDWSEAWYGSWDEADDGYDDWAELQDGETSDQAGNIYWVDEKSKEAFINEATGNVKREWRKLPRTFRPPFMPHGRGTGKGKGKEKGKRKGKSKRKRKRHTER